MIYSGVDLIRSSGQAAARAERLVESTPQEVQATQPKQALDEQTGNALLRFARFVREKNGKEKQKEKQKDRLKKDSQNPYLKHQLNAEARENLGKILNISI